MWEPEPGEYTLCSRGTDEHDRTQPERIGDVTDGSVEGDEYPWNEGGYAANAYAPHSVSVTVRAD